MRKTIVITSLIVFVAAIMAPAAMAEDGAALFKGKCQACHGAKGEGKAAMKTQDLGGPAIQKLTDAQLTDIIANGKDGKATHAYKKKGLTDEQIKALVSFVRTLKK
jgi:mono/diheme cytochrome c family protein